MLHFLFARCTAFALTFINDEKNTEVIKEGCRLVEEACMNLLVCYQIIRREKGDSLVTKALRPLLENTFDSTRSLCSIVKDKGKKNSISPGTGFVWTCCDVLSKFEVSNASILLGILKKAEADAVDTIEEMKALPSVEDDEEDGCTEEELRAVEEALGCIKAARGALRGSQGMISGCVDSSLSGLVPFVTEISKGVENLGCTFYPPQDRAEMKGELVTLKKAIHTLFDQLSCMTFDEELKQKITKMQSLSAVLCENALTKIKEENE